MTGIGLTLTGGTGLEGALVGGTGVSIAIVESTYINLGAAAAAGSAAAFPPTLPGAGTHVFSLFNTGGRRDANTSSAGNIWTGPPATTFVSAIDTVQTTITTRTNVGGMNVSRTVTASVTLGVQGVNASDGMSACAGLLIRPGFEMKQRKSAKGSGTSIADGAVTFDNPVAADSEVVVCLHHAEVTNPVTTAPTNSSLLSAAFTLGAGGTRPAGVRLYALTGLAGGTAIPGLTFDTTRVWGYQAVEYGPV